MDGRWLWLWSVSHSDKLMLSQFEMLSWGHLISNLFYIINAHTPLHLQSVGKKQNSLIKHQVCVCKCVCVCVCVHVRAGAGARTHAHTHLSVCSFVCLAVYLIEFYLNSLGLIFFFTEE